MSRKKKQKRTKPPVQYRFEEYIVYRQRLKQFLHLHQVMIHLIECPNLSPTPEEHLGTFRVFSVSHLAGFFDTYADSLRAFEVWRFYLPQHGDALDKAEQELAPLLAKAKDIRSNIWAHSNLSIDTQNRVLAALPQGDAVKLLTGFLEIAELVTKSESSMPELAKAIEKWGLRPGADIPL